MGNEWLTVVEVAQRLKVTEETVRRWLRSGKLHGKKLGPTKAGYRVASSEVDRLLGPESEAPSTTD